jgi:hypothetical protein
MKSMRERFDKEFLEDIKLILEHGSIGLGSLMKFIEKEKQRSYREGQKDATDLERSIRMQYKYDPNYNYYTHSDMIEACEGERIKTIKRIKRWAEDALKSGYPIRYLIAGIEQMEDSENRRNFGN